MRNKIIRTDQHFGQNNGGHRVLRQAIAALNTELDGLEYVGQLYTHSAHANIQGAEKSSRQLRIIREQIATLTLFLEGGDQTLATFLEQLGCTRKPN